MADPPIGYMGHARAEIFQFNLITAIVSDLIEDNLGRELRATPKEAGKPE
jgi:hypothetical protein